MKLDKPATRSVILVTLLFALCGQIVPRTALASADFSQICAKAIHAAEIAKQLPRFLLHAVSLTESGRWHDKAQAAIAWPWTITAGGKGKYFRTKAKALDEVKRLQSQGISNIDVGCMQKRARKRCRRIGEGHRRTEKPGYGTLRAAFRAHRPCCAMLVVDSHHGASCA